VHGRAGLGHPGRDAALGAALGEQRAREERDGLLVFRNPKLEPASGRPVLRVLSLDIETTPDASRVPHE
jgi:hypothetical protein